MTGDRNTQLAPAHREELHESGLTDATIEAAGIRTISGTKISDRLGWKPKKFTWGDGIEFPFLDADGNPTGFCQVKPTHPRSSAGKTVKYETPRGPATRAYFPPGFAKQFARSKVVILTEGVKKALKANQEGFPTIGLSGVWGFQQKRPRADNGRAYGERRLIPDLAGIDWNGREVVIAFDSDVTEKHLVQLAQARLAEALTHRGAKITAVLLPANGDEKVGLDDFMVKHGAEAFGNLLATAKEVESPKLSLMDTARMLVDDQFRTHEGPRLRFYRGEFWRWTGRRWRRLEAEAMPAKALEWLDRRGFKATPQRAMDLVKCLQSILYTDAETEMPTFLDGIRGRVDPLQIVATANTLLDLGNAKDAGIPILEHSAQWFSAVVTDYDYSPDAECPNWLEFLCSSLSADMERHTLLRQWFGYLLTANTRLQKMLILIGPPRSGKGTITRVLRRVVGESNCVCPTLSSLGSDFGLWSLMDKSVAVIGDAHLGHRTDSVRVVETLKAVVGEDPIDVQRKYLSTVPGVRLRVRFVLSMNELIKVTDTTKSLVPRMSVITFDTSFAGRENRDLERRLMGELPGILCWSLRGWHHLRQAGEFTVPNASMAVLRNFGRLISPVSEFVEECCETGDGASVSRADLFSAWSGWAQANGHRPGSSPVFGERIRALQLDIADRRPRVKGVRQPREYVGIGLNDYGTEMLSKCVIKPSNGAA